MELNYIADAIQHSRSLMITSKSMCFYIYKAECKIFKLVYCYSPHKQDASALGQNVVQQHNHELLSLPMDVLLIHCLEWQ